jgi:3-methyladenine DNA glycosylase AlkD
MNIEEVIQDVELDLRRRGSRKRRKGGSRYFDTEMEVLGVAVPPLRSVAKTLHRRVKDEPIPEILDLAQRLVDRGVFEVRQVAYELLSYHKRALARLKTRRVEQLGRGNDNWGSVDSFAILVAGPAWREGNVTDKAVRRWAESDDRWWRRTALVATVPLNRRSRGGRGDEKRTLEICRLLLDDRDEMVVKAMSWALRTLLVANPEAARLFMEENEELLAPRVLREVKNKMWSGVKAPRPKKAAKKKAAKKKAAKKEAAKKATKKKATKKKAAKKATKKKAAKKTTKKKAAKKTTKKKAAKKATKKKAAKKATKKKAAKKATKKKAAKKATKKKAAKKTAKKKASKKAK